MSFGLVRLNRQRDKPSQMIVGFFVDLSDFGYCDEICHQQAHLLAVDFPAVFWHWPY